MQAKISVCICTDNHQAIDELMDRVREIGHVVGDDYAAPATMSVVVEVDHNIDAGKIAHAMGARKISLLSMSSRQVDGEEGFRLVGEVDFLTEMPF